MAAADGTLLATERSVIEQSGTIRNMLTDLHTTPTSEPIHIPNVSGPILSKIIEYCQHHRQEEWRRQPAQTEEDCGGDSSEKAVKRAIGRMDQFDHEFCRQVDQGTLFDIMLAANFLDIPPLLDLVGYTVAQMMQGKSVEELRATFNVESDFTQEQEQKVRKENEWCED